MEDRGVCIDTKLDKVPGFHMGGLRCILHRLDMCLHMDHLLEDSVLRFQKSFLRTLDQIHMHRHKVAYQRTCINCLLPSSTLFLNHTSFRMDRLSANIAPVRLHFSKYRPCYERIFGCWNKGGHTSTISDIHIRIDQTAQH